MEWQQTHSLIHLLNLGNACIYSSPWFIFFTIYLYCFVAAPNSYNLREVFHAFILTYYLCKGKDFRYHQILYYSSYSKSKQIYGTQRFDCNTWSLQTFYSRYARKVSFRVEQYLEKWLQVVFCDGNLPFPASGSPSARIRLRRIDEPRTDSRERVQKMPNARLHSVFFGTPDGNRTHN